MKQKFRELKLTPERRTRLAQINAIITEYSKQGYRLTLRQLYYQLVSRDIIPNQQNEYKKLSDILTQGRMCGLVDWEAIVDRIRTPSRPAAFCGPIDAMKALIQQYRLDRLEDQDTYIEVWVEKDALSEVLGRVTQEYGINILVNRGYGSASSMYDAYQRFQNHDRVRVLYIGDFDPSGLDMIRDITDRINEFLADHSIDFEVIPIALNREQIDQYDPPPNPAKTTDSRYEMFAAEHGTQSWEVDSLDPAVLDQLLRDHIEALIDRDLYDEQVDEEKRGHDLLTDLMLSL